MISSLFSLVAFVVLAWTLASMLFCLLAAEHPDLTDSSRPNVFRAVLILALPAIFIVELFEDRDFKALADDTLEALRLGHWAE